MLDISTAKVVKVALDDYFKYDAISLEKVCTMLAIPASSDAGIAILALQYRNITVMVRIEVEDSGVVVREVKTLGW